MDLIGKTDPYVVSYLTSNPSQKIKTNVIKDNLDPVWDFSSSISVDLLREDVKDDILIFELFDEDVGRSEHIGNVEIQFLDLIEKPNEEIENDYEVLNPKKKEAKS